MMSPTFIVVATILALSLGFTRAISTTNLAIFPLRTDNLGISSVTRILERRSPQSNHEHTVQHLTNEINRSNRGMVSRHEAFLRQIISGMKEDEVNSQITNARNHYAIKAAAFERDMKHLPSNVRKRIPELKWPDVLGPKPEWRLIDNIVYVLESGDLKRLSRLPK